MGVLIGNSIAKFSVFTFAMFCKQLVLK